MAGVSSWRSHLIVATPTLAVVGVALAWACSYGGFPATHWYPGAVGLVLVLAALVAGLRPAIRELPRSLQIALGALALFTAWSFASILWADSQGVAWDGANRTLLYLVMFAIPALSRLDGPRARVVVGVWTTGIIVLAAWVLIKLPDAVGPGPAVLGPGLAAPIGYSNAEACLWLMAAWPALLLSSRAALPSALRGLFAGGALVLFDVALLSESNGAVIAAGICLVVLLVALPGRVRMLLTLVPVAVGAALTAPHAIDVSYARRAAGATTGELASLAMPVLGIAVVLAAVVTAAALLERRRPPSPATIGRVNRAVASIAVVATVVGVAAILGATGNPIDTVNGRWDSFKQPTTAAGSGGGSLVDLGGARYDYYRVALDVIVDHPWLGVGADNFAQDYAARGRSSEFPAYAHSIELRTLLHTGAVGGLLLATSLGAALFGASCAARARSRPGAAAAGAAVMVFVHWFVQGSIDWFWEFPALGGAVFAMLGVACALVPRRDAVERSRAPRTLRLGGMVAGVALLVACCASLAAPWTSAIETQQAGRLWPIDADAALRKLDLAADLNPLSSHPALVEGTIALRLGRLQHAREAFTRALERDPRESYAMLALGAIASQGGDRTQALVYLRRAARLNRQDAVTLGALQVVRSHGRIGIRRLLRQYELRARTAQL